MTMAIAEMMDINAEKIDMENVTMAVCEEVGIHTNLDLGEVEVVTTFGIFDLRVQRCSACSHLSSGIDPRVQSTHGVTFFLLLNCKF